MPYITKDSAKEIDPFFDISFPPTATSVGQLNYFITRQIVDFLQNSNKKYADYNEAIGVLECAKLELYRRMVAQYEEFKISDPLNVDPYEQLEEELWEDNQTK